MEIITDLKENVLTIKLVGRLDTTTAPELENKLKTDLENVTELVFDFEELEYISSAGLRVLLAAQKVMNKQGSMLIKNVCDEINDVFEITGFLDILTVEGKTKEA